MMHSMTFNVCKDNGKAADDFVARVKVAGGNAERLEVPPEALAHAEAVGQKSPPASASHDLDPDAAIKIAIEVEKANV